MFAASLLVLLVPPAQSGCPASNESLTVEVDAAVDAYEAVYRAVLAADATGS